MCVCGFVFLFDLFFIFIYYNKFLSLEARSRGLVRYTIILHSNHTTVRLSSIDNPQLQHWDEVLTTTHNVNNK